VRQQWTTCWPTLGEERWAGPGRAGFLVQALHQPRVASGWRPGWVIHLPAQ